MDPISKEIRSKMMSAIRKRGNRSTEWKLRSALVRAGICGWVMHHTALPGCPDFWFERPRLAIFVDGCFWHNCRQCQIPTPRSNRAYWKRKLLKNANRAKVVGKALRHKKIRVIRVWEHELASPSITSRLLIRIARSLSNRQQSNSNGRTVKLNCKGTADPPRYRTDE